MTDLFTIGVDPGPSTGLALLADDELRFRFQGEPVKALAVLRQWLMTLRGQRVIGACERFTVTNQTAVKSAQPVPQRTIGMVEALFMEFGRVLYFQSPGDAKLLAPNALLRGAGLWSTGRDVQQRDADDANDATRHAVLLLATRRASLFERIVERAERR